MSCVIPTLNAAATLAATLAALGTVGEVLVVDGGSTDATVAVARAAGVRVVAAEPGRGRQMAAGIAVCRRAWILLLHADTVLASGWEIAAARHMTGHTAGYFRFRLNTTRNEGRTLERAVAWRCRVLGLPYGDQGLLLPRALLDQVGGVRPLPLMEDVDLVRRLHGRLRPIGADAVTSAAKWEREGYRLRSARNLLCLSLYFAGVSPRLIRRVYG